nr:hypothetical protein [Streptomyces sp. DSM 41633]
MTMVGNVGSAAPMPVPPGSASRTGNVAAARFSSRPAAAPAMTAAGPPGGRATSGQRVGSMP